MENTATLTPKAMEPQQVLHMVGGDGETSYANNSQFQRTVISKAKSIRDETIQDLIYQSSSSSDLPECLRIADLGCSSGPNSLVVISDTIDAIHEACNRLHQTLPEFQVFLNDLPGNDFTSIFKSLPSFYETLLQKEKGKEEYYGRCFITVMPGSFYGRLFPTQSLHFVHSSFSIHWLSQVPPGVKSESGNVLNKGNIYIGKTSPSSVINAYSQQFQKDFSSFLKFRSEELVPGGRMVIITLGHRSDQEPWDDGNCKCWELLSMALTDMALEGLVEQSKVDSFDLPFYAPSALEIKDLILAEGSFKLNQIETFEIDEDDEIEKGDDDDDDSDGREFDIFEIAQNVSRTTRAATEPMLMSHFGEEAIINDLFQRYAKKVVEHLVKEKLIETCLIVSMTRMG
ncbi:probable jasmonic acid carboxyl methyltransferase 2 [Macadamia integrifolia]|uniref:probable jasmonic acid carboxyl methyltransferase 2 n=1 Tax=Macadamia integrifolia TaxID=60698 RepID=UPI001C4F0911|nr:probable jasmonic acid carboxyl methyltransferase 2 [Macadamia integrifolia]